MASFQPDTKTLQVEIFAFNEQAWINGEIKDFVEHHG